MKNEEASFGADGRVLVAHGRVLGAHGHILRAHGRTLRIHFVFRFLKLYK